MEFNRRYWVGVDEAYGLIAPIAHNNGNAPETAHILWAKQLQTGGLAGGIDFGPQSYDCGDAYEGLFGAPVIIAGVLYYNQFKADGALRVEQNVVAVDLHTGEELWIKQLVGPDGIGRRLSFGQVFYFSSFNYHAVFSYLWTVDGTTWHAFDPFTGRWVYSMTNVPAGKNLYGPKGEIYRYTVNIANGWMTLWNSSKAVQPQTTGGSGDGSWVRGQMGTTINATRGIEWNKTLPEGLTGSLSETYFSNRIYFQERMVGTAKTSTDINIWSVNLKPGQEGQLLFKTTWKLPVENITLVLGQTISIEDDVFTIYSPELRQHWALA